MGDGALAGEDGLGLGGGVDAPHLGEGVEVEGEVVEATIGSDGYGAVGEAVELDVAVDEVPDLAVAGVEDVGAVAVHVDALDLFAVGVAAGVGTLVDYEAAAAAVSGDAGKGGAK